MLPISIRVIDFPKSSKHTSSHPSSINKNYLFFALAFSTKTIPSLKHLPSAPLPEFIQNQPTESPCYTIFI